MLKSYLDEISDRYEQASFVQDDPVSIPHGFDDASDREIIGLYAALLAWGRRDVLLRKLGELCERMRYRPARFVSDFNPARDGKRLDGFVHRTFSSTDAINLTIALQSALSEFGSLENLFLTGTDRTDSIAHDASQNSDLAQENIRLQAGLEYFSATLLAHSPGDRARMRRVLARPSTGSACKRLVMYLRWMTRPGPVDLNLWSALEPYELMLPLDVHSGRQARSVGVLRRKSNDWKAVCKLTNACRSLCPDDPARYNFAFFGTGSAGELLKSPVV